MQRETKARKVGTVTVLFTDLVGSTEILDRIGDDAADHMRRKHFRMLRHVARDWDGLEVKSLGDGLMIVFSSAYDAVACAIAIQKKSADEPDRAQVRVGLHTGEVAWEEGDVFGTPVVVARRLCDSAGGGQILASDLVRSLLGSRGGFSFRDVGFMELKGLRTAIPASEILLPDHIPELERGRSEAKGPHRFGRWAVLGGLVVVAASALWFALPFDRQGKTTDRQSPRTGSRDLRWSREPAGAGLGGAGEQVMLDVATRGSSIVVAGRDDRGGDRDAVVWLRRGSQSWSQVTLEAPSDRAGDQWVNGITTLGRRVIAVGGRGGPGTYDASAWTSRDGGSSWEGSVSPRPGGAGLQVMNDVTRGPLGLVAVGYETLYPGQTSAAVWVSESGVDWTRIKDQQQLVNGKALSVAAEGSTIVAVGRAESDVEGWETDSAVWVSVSGNMWERQSVESLQSPGYQVMTTVLPGGPGFIAAGYDTLVGDADAAIWTSRDGTSWKRVGRSDELFGGPGTQRIYTLTRYKGLYIAAGLDGPEDHVDAGVWVSSDGERWRRETIADELGGDLNQEIRSLALLSDGLIAVGIDQAGGDLDAAVWTARVRRR